jgi:hypothetical protein
MKITEYKTAAHNNSSYMAVMFDSAQPTPCQFSVQGSPPFVTHPGTVGDPSAVYRPFIANTVKQIKRSPQDYKNIFALSHASQIVSARCKTALF